MAPTSKIYTPGSAYSMNSTINTNFGTVAVEVATKDEIKKIEGRLHKIEERLCILSPAFELHEKYPALKEAYDAYCLVEKLVNENSKKRI